ncbi:MAG TPA: hypothetical protein VJK30_00845 [Coxiellaceae bacterium]|nr:MAG: hypothetical protein A3E81_05095 [Gammaproteobacteria bacterium RIFCSPHIGHO2_12_FULL_36_30]HLB55865.1 hypothetical protein [Coxiellaceae bacterium]
MNKKIISALAITIAATCFTSAFGASTLSFHKTKSYTDYLNITFLKFSANKYMYEAYKNNNGVDIIGPAFVNPVPNHPAFIKIFSNTGATGNPSMSLDYSGTSGDCEITFVDGPHTNLAYKNGNVPFCADEGMIVSTISKLKSHHYAITITKM